MDRLIRAAAWPTHSFKRKASIGNSLVEPEMHAQALAILEKAQSSGTELLLPADTLCADAFAPDANTQVVPTNAIPADWMGLDIGPETTARFVDVVLTSKTVLWNGPMGVLNGRFANGTTLQPPWRHRRQRRLHVDWGWDSVAAINQAGLRTKSAT